MTLPHTGTNRVNARAFQDLFVGAAACVKRLAGGPFKPRRSEVAKTGATAKVCWSRFKSGLHSSKPGGETPALWANVCFGAGNGRGIVSMASPQDRPPRAISRPTLFPERGRLRCQTETRGHSGRVPESKQDGIWRPHALLIRKETAGSLTGRPAAG